MSLIQTTTPLLGNAVFNSGSLVIPRAVYISGSVLADQNGTLYVEQSGDGVNWDVSNPLNVVANAGVGFQESLVSPFMRIRYVNGALGQTIFRLYGDCRDAFGSFLVSQPTPSAGGAYLSLYYDPIAAHYVYVGRFDGTDGTNVNEQAAVFNKLGGKYASVPVTLFTVTQETLLGTSQSTTASF